MPLACHTLYSSSTEGPIYSSRQLALKGGVSERVSRITYMVQKLYSFKSKALNLNFEIIFLKYELCRDCKGCDQCQTVNFCNIWGKFCLLVIACVFAILVIIQSNLYITVRTNMASVDRCPFYKGSA